MSEPRPVAGAPATERCERKRRALLRDLESLTRPQLQTLGLWDGAIADTAAELLAQEGCPVHGGAR